MKKTGRFKKSIMTMAMALMLSVTAVAGFGTSVKAANTEDEPYTYSNANSNGNTNWRNKTDYTKVYVHPTSGPTIKYAVFGSTTGTGDGTVRSTYHQIPNGTYASITNTVKEKGDNYARLRLVRIQNINQDTKGVWSPDSTRNYTIYG